MNEPTTTELLDAIVGLHGAMLFGFSKAEEREKVRDARVEGRFDTIEGKLGRIETRVEHLETDMGEVKDWISRKDRRKR